MTSSRARKLGLESFDKKLMDGLLFSRKVYEFFEQLGGEPDGRQRILLRKDSDAKRLMEELLPLARYIQNNYMPGRYIKVRWHSGSQPFDAELISRGSFVTRAGLPAKVKVEITTAVHERHHLTRELTAGGAPGHWGSEGTYRDQKTRQIVSQPHVTDGFERADALAKLVAERLSKKAEKSYPDGTVLIVACVVESYLDQWQWDRVVARLGEVRTTISNLNFGEIVLIDSLNRRSANI